MSARYDTICKSEMVAHYNFEGIALFSTRNTKQLRLMKTITLRDLFSSVLSLSQWTNWVSLHTLPLRLQNSAPVFLVLPKKQDVSVYFLWSEYCVWLELKKQGRTEWKPKARKWWILCQNIAIPFSPDCTLYYLFLCDIFDHNRSYNIHS